MRTLILAGVSAIALAFGGTAYAGSNSANSGASHNGSSSMSSGSSSQGSQAMNASQDQIKHAQQTLKSEGLYKGQVDGIEGPETTQALENFQKKNGLKQTGSIDQETMNKLMGSGQTTGSGSSTPPKSGGTSGSSMGQNHQQPSSGSGGSSSSSGTNK